MKQTIARNRCNRAVLLAVLGLFSRMASADSLIDRLQRSTVYIRIQTLDDVKLGNQIGTVRATVGGTGFFVDDRHIITNWHVCCDVDATPHQETIDGRDVMVAERARGPVTVLLRGQYVAVKILTASQPKDLAILELPQDSGRPVVTLVPDNLVSVDQRTIAVGFPGAARGVVDERSMDAPSVTEGVISRKVIRAPDPQDGSLGVASALYQTTTAINPGNSGGPLFDSWGRVVGVNELGIPSAQGTNFSIRADEVIALCKANNIVPSIAWLPVLSNSSSLFSLSLQAATAILALGAILFTLTRRGRQLVKQSASIAWDKVATATTERGRRLEPRPERGPGLRPERRPALRPEPPAPQPAARRPAISIIGVSGSYAGQGFPCDNGPLIAGRDPGACNLLFPKGMDKISRMHCKLTGDPEQGTLILQDLGSTNGTFLGNGERLASGQRAMLKNGDRFYLADPENSFEASVRRP